jgi:hypothetical protein
MPKRIVFEEAQVQQLVTKFIWVFSVGCSVLLATNKGHLGHHNGSPVTMFLASEKLIYYSLKIMIS